MAKEGDGWDRTVGAEYDTKRKDEVNKERHKEKRKIKRAD
jgi:hypothetical protein